MRHHNLQLVVISFLGFVSLTLVQSQEHCDNPIGQTGTCINIRECQPLLALLRKYRTSDAVKDFLKTSVCDQPPDSDPKVCCVHGDRKTDMNVFSTLPPFPTFPTFTTPSSRAVFPDPQKSKTYWPIFAPNCGISKVTLERVVGGGPARLGTWPWIAALGYPSKTSNNPIFLCGGSLISSRHVLTAAHCLKRDPYVVRLGDLDLDDAVDDGASPITVPIEEIHKHPRYSEKHLTSDIAVLKLKWDVEFTDLIRPICLPLIDEVASGDLSRSRPFVAGWGSTYFRGPRATHLQQVQLPIVKEETCRAAFRRFKEIEIDNRVICAGFTAGGRDSCEGDSGGPLILPKHGAFYAIGVVSFGDRCAEPGIPGVYSRVSEFLDFIRSHVE